MRPPPIHRFKPKAKVYHYLRGPRKTWCGRTVETAPYESVPPKGATLCGWCGRTYRSHQRVYGRGDE